MIAAFFDIDGTLYRNSLLIEHFKKLIKYEIVDEKIWSGELKNSFEKWNDRKGDYEGYLEYISEIYKNVLKGIDIEDIEFAARQVVEKTWLQTYKYTRQRVEYHVNENHKVIFISGSPYFLVGKIAEKYKVKDFRASEYGVDEFSRFNGDVKPMWDSLSKQKAVDNYVKKYNINLKESYSYGDTMGDLSMLKLTGNPVAINPNMKLINEISGNKDLFEKLKIVVERKDVIYELDCNTTKFRYK